MTEFFSIPPSFPLKYKLVLLLVIRLLRLHLAPRPAQPWFHFFLILKLLSQKVPWRTLLFLLLHLRKFVVKSYYLQILKVLLWLILHSSSKLVLLLPPNASLKMVECGFLELIDRTVHVLWPGLFFRYNFSTHNVIVIAEPGDFIFDNFGSSVFGTAVGYIDELIFVEGIDWDVFFLSYFEGSLLQPGQLVTFVWLWFENFWVNGIDYRREN